MGYPSGQVRLLRMKGKKQASYEWKDITDQIHCVKDKSLNFIELRVNQFCW
jgi:hypothetical protein